VLTPLRLDFGSERIGQSTPVQYLTVANTGTAPTGMKPISISGPFAISANTCGSSLAVNTSCTVGVIFSPTASGVASGSLVVTDDMGTQTALLSGTGQSGPTDALSANGLNFAPQVIGTTSAAQQVTVTNSGDSALTGITVQTTGDFPATNLCGTALPAHSTCAIQVVFSPKAVGAERGQLTIQDARGSQAVALSGTGILPAAGTGATLSPLTIDFGIQGLNSISAPQLVTVINNGTTALSGIAVAASQGFGIVSNACTVTVGPGASCTVGVTFAPQTPGTVAGTVQVTGAGLAAPLNLPLTGTGADFQLSVQGSASSIVTGGSSATYQLLLTPVGASAGSVSFTCAGAPAGSTCSANPTSVSMTGTGATATIQVTVTTVATSAAARKTHSTSPPWRGRSAAAVALASLVLWRRRGLAGPLGGCRVLLVLGALCLGLTGCGLSVKGGASPPAGSGDSGQGVFTLTVGGSAPGILHTVTLNLTVE
jgi:hypothetical protein